MREISQVIWLQLGTIFADFRVHPESNASPNWLDRSQAFSGRLSVEGDLATWHHDLECPSLGREVPDQAALKLDGDLLIEEGTDYVEHWTLLDSLSESGNFVAELYAPSDTPNAGPTNEAIIARVVSVGGSAIGLWHLPQRGAALLRNGRQWEIVSQIGDKTGAASIEELLRSLSEDDATYGEWQIVRY